jgi:hypothetical protein
MRRVSNHCLLSIMCDSSLKPISRRVDVSSRTDRTEKQKYRLSFLPLMGYYWQSWQNYFVKNCADNKVNATTARFLGCFGNSLFLVMVLNEQEGMKRSNSLLGGSPSCGSRRAPSHRKKLFPFFPSVLVLYLSRSWVKTVPHLSTLRLRGFFLNTGPGTSQMHLGKAKIFNRCSIIAERSQECPSLQSCM